MKIQSIKIKDSKTILNSFEWSSDKPINIFIGENGSGKSTILKSIFDAKLQGVNYKDHKIVCFSSAKLI